MYTSHLSTSKKTAAGETDISSWQSAIFEELGDKISFGEKFAEKVTEKSCAASAGRQNSPPSSGAAKS